MVAPLDLITVKVAARLLGLRPSSVYRRVRSGLLKAYRTSPGRLLVSRAEVLAGRKMAG